MSSATSSSASLPISSVQIASSFGFALAAVFTTRVISSVPSASRVTLSAAPRLCTSAMVTLRRGTSTSIPRAVSRGTRHIG